MINLYTFIVDKKILSTVLGVILFLSSVHGSTFSVSFYDQFIVLSFYQINSFSYLCQFNYPWSYSTKLHNL